MNTVKVAIFYFLGFLASTLLLELLDNYFQFIVSPYHSVDDIVFGALFFTFFFTLFDKFVLRAWLKGS